MSAPSIAPFLPFRRVRVVGQRVQGDPATALFELAPDRRFTPRCGRCGARAPRIHSRYRRRVRDLSLGVHRVWLRLLAIDEIALLKGYRYMTVVLD